jgi:hypothetical protein
MSEAVSIQLPVIECLYSADNNTERKGDPDMYNSKINVTECSILAMHLQLYEHTILFK